MNQFAWFKENLEKFDKFFRPRIDELLIENQPDVLHNLIMKCPCFCYISFRTSFALKPYYHIDTG